MNDKPTPTDPENTDETAQAQLERSLAEIDTEAEAEAVVEEVVEETEDKTVAEAAKEVSEQEDAAEHLKRAAATETDEVEEAAAVIEATATEAAALEEDDEAADEAIERAISQPLWYKEEDYTRPRRLLLDAFLRLRAVPPLQRFDAELFLLINSEFPHPPVLNSFFRGVALAFRNGYAWMAGIALLLPFRPRRTRQLLTWTVPSVLISSVLVEQGLKPYFSRRRPFLRIVRSVLIGSKPSSWSFPSGHSAAAFAGAHALSKLVPRLRSIWYAIAFVVGFCRAYLGAHYPSDILFGGLCGIGFTELTFWVLRRLGFSLSEQEGR